MTSIVTVCTGNICRSPAAELLLARALGPDAVVTSAGTYAMVGHGIPDPMLTCLAADGVDGTLHTSSQFSGAHAKADLIVCMAERHRAWVLTHGGASPERTFLLSELAEVARAAAPLDGGIAGVASAAFGYRPNFAGLTAPDVPDPYGGSQGVYDSAYRMIRSLVGDVADWVAG